MNYKITLTSQDIDTFSCEIAIKGSDSFLTLHKEIAKALHFDNSQMVSFFVLDKHGNRIQEIVQMDMGSFDEEKDSDDFDPEVEEDGFEDDMLKPAVMEETTIESVFQKNEKVEYQYNLITEEFLTLEGEPLKAAAKQHFPAILACVGDLPTQGVFAGETDKWSDDHFDDDEELSESGHTYDFSFLDEFENSGSGGGSLDDDFDDDELGGGHFENIDDYIDSI